MAKTTVTATIIDQASDPIPGALVTAKLDRIDAGGGFVLPDFYDYVADGLGVVTMELWPNEEGVTASAYEITISTPDKTSVERFEAVIPVSAAPVDLYACAALPTYPPRDIAYEVQQNAAAAQASEDTSAANAATAIASALESEHWANMPEDTLVPEGDMVDDYSAMHHANKSAASATASNTAKLASEAAQAASEAAQVASETAQAGAETAEANAGTSEVNSAASEAKAQKWADELEDVEVEIGKYSAKHHAAKAAASDASALAHKNAAGVSETNAAASEAAADADRIAAEAAKVASQTAQGLSEAAQLASETAQSLSEAARAGAETAEANAGTHEAKAQKWAEELENVEVEPGKFSAFHWAQKAQAYATGQMVYQGSWDASTGVYPSDPVPVTGHYYKISVAGTISGTVYAVGDSIIYNGSGWDKIDSTDQVTSVAGRQGAIVLSSADITDFATQMATKLDVNGGTMTGALTVPSSFTVQKTDDVNEGGEIHLEAPTAWNAAYIDLYQNLIRFRKVGGSNLQYNLDNGDLSVPGNLLISGNVDGRDVAADGAKLDGIEAGATADQTKADIDALSINAYQVGGVQATQIVYGENQSGSRTANPTQTASDIAQYKSGFWDANAAGWTPDTSWWWGMTIAHTSGSPTYLYNAQLAFKNDIVNPEVYLRANGGGGTPSWGSWKKIYHAGNFGKTQIDALNINADQVDGYHATAYNVFTGNAIVTRHASGYIFSNYFNFPHSSATSSNPTAIAVENSNDGYIRWQVPDVFFGNTISGLTADASPVGSTDYVVTYDASANTGKKVLLDNLPAPSLGAASVARTHLKTTTASGSKSIGTGGSSYTLTGSTYSWWTMGSTNQSSGAILGWGGNDTAAGVVGLCVSDPFSSAGNKTAYFDERYVQASPPYKLDDIVPIFIFALVNSDGTVDSIRVSEDPPWAYHGPTNICADRYASDGRTYRREKKHVIDSLIGLKPSVLEQMKNPATRDEAVWRIENESTIEEFEITLDFKNTDIDVMPHWWVHNIAQGEDMTGKTVLMLDTTSDLAVHLMEILHVSNATEVRELFDRDYIRFSRSPLSRTAPPGVTVVSAAWKNTK